MGIFKNAFVGLEIDSYEAKVVEVKGNATSPKLVNYGKIAMPEGAVRDGIIYDPERVGKALSELWSRSKIKTREVILGVTNQDLLVRFATFPKVPNDKLDNMIRFQAQDFLPMPVNTVVIDYIVINEVSNSEGRFLEVLLVAARKTMVNGFISSLEQAELKPRDIDVTSLALWRMIPDQEKNDAMAVVNLGNEVGNILLMVKGVPRLARHISVNLRGFLNRYMDSDWATGDILLALDRLSPEEADEFGGMVANEIQSSINYYYVQNHAEAIRKIILCGYAGRIDGLIDRLQAVIDIPIVISDPLERFSLKNRHQHMDGSTASEYAISMSLALRGLEGWTR